MKRYSIVTVIGVCCLIIMNGCGTQKESSVNTDKYENTTETQINQESMHSQIKDNYTDTVNEKASDASINIAEMEPSSIAYNSNISVQDIAITDEPWINNEIKSQSIYNYNMNNENSTDNSRVSEYPSQSVNSDEKKDVITTEPFIDGIADNNSEIRKSNAGNLPEYYDKGNLSSEPSISNNSATISNGYSSNQNGISGNMFSSNNVGINGITVLAVENGIKQYLNSNMSTVSAPDGTGISYIESNGYVIELKTDFSGNVYDAFFSSDVDNAIEFLKACASVFSAEASKWIGMDSINSSSSYNGISYALSDIGNCYVLRVTN